MAVAMAAQQTLYGEDTRTWHGGLLYWRRVNDERIAAGKPPLRQLISTGRGTQTNCLLAMSAHGLIDMPAEAGFFGDTLNEPSEVHRYAEALELGLDTPVFTVTRGSLLADELKINFNAAGQPYLKTNMPVFIKNADGSVGRAKRKCTYDYKIRPVQQEMERYLGIQPGSRQEPVACVWMGITTDEAHRADPSEWGRAINRWPLLELGMSRQDCIDWMQEHGYGTPVRSACAACPNRTDTGWVLLKKNPSLFRGAVNFERALQRKWAALGRLDGVPFLHRSCVPLDQVEFEPVRGEPAIFGCLEGVCDV